MEQESVTPDPEVLVKEPSAIGDKRLEFEPWTVVQVGGVEVLDDLPKKGAKEMVRAVAVEIATYEGPIHLGRLTDKTAQSFGLQRVRSNRLKKISYQIQAGRPLRRRGQVRLAARDRPRDLGRVPAQRQHRRPPLHPHQPSRDRQRRPLHHGQAPRHPGR